MSGSECLQAALMAAGERLSLYLGGMEVCLCIPSPGGSTKGEHEEGHSTRMLCAEQWSVGMASTVSRIGPFGKG